MEPIKQEFPAEVQESQIHARFSRYSSTIHVHLLALHELIYIVGGDHENLVWIQARVRHCYNNLSTKVMFTSD